MGTHEASDHEGLGQALATRAARRTMPVSSMVPGPADPEATSTPATQLLASAD